MSDVEMEGDFLQFNQARSDRALRAAKKREGKNRTPGRGHPTTSEMDYTDEEDEFMNAIQEYKRVSGRQFPTWCDALRILRSLGYVRILPASAVHASIAAVLGPEADYRAA